MAMGLFDILGRRSLVFHGGYSQAAFLVTIGALGRIPNPNANQSNGIVAGMQLYTCILHMTLGPGAYITAAEIGTQDLREKTMALAVSRLLKTVHWNFQLNLYRLGSTSLLAL